MKETTAERFQINTVKMVTRTIDSLAANELQTEDRTTTAALDVLDKKIQMTHTILPPVILPDGTMIDGHRRVAVAKRLGLKAIQCLTLSGNGNGKVDSVASFIDFNAATRVFTGNTWLRIWLQATDRKQILSRAPFYTASRIKRLVHIFGTKRLETLVPQIESPNIVEWIDLLARVFNEQRLDFDTVKLAEWVVLYGVKWQIQSANSEVGAARNRIVRGLHTAMMQNKAYVVRGGQRGIKRVMLKLPPNPRTGELRAAGKK